ncbi:hypothetical protein B9Z19DRAFT_1073983 [Tuber borchii]|uniref:Uncharacterized protein n=1 Tax=Tuber borchii TaxID=42251 RepID=A0A2T7A5J1_TUBBO|nr:hypothetical protein B9Z19DRAFT_1073983 [Tuber borchii]
MDGELGHQAGCIAGTSEVEEITPIQAAEQANIRHRLTSKEKLVLVRLCVLHGGEYSLPSGRERFWSKMQGLFSTTLDCPASNPRVTISRMLTEYTKKIERERKETGTAQIDGEYEQAMELWRSRVESSGDGRGNHTGGEESQGKKNKKAEKLAAEAHRSNMLTTLSQKRDFQTVMLALEKHDKEEEKKKEKGGPIEPDTLSKAAKWEVKAESLKDKRRKIKEQVEYLNMQLAEEGNRITGILEQVAVALLASTKQSAPVTISKENSPESLQSIKLTSDHSELSSPLQRTSHSAMGDLPGLHQERFSHLEKRVQGVEKELKEVQDNTNKILKILESEN